MQFFTGLRFEVEQALHGLSGIAELLVFGLVLSSGVTIISPCSPLL